MCNGQAAYVPRERYYFVLLGNFFQLRYIVAVVMMAMPIQQILRTGGSSVRHYRRRRRRKGVYIAKALLSIRVLSFHFNLPVLVSSSEAQGFER
jgi:hypothetical protein